MAIIKIDQGWYLTLLSSILCVAGCFIICLDLLYALLLPSLSKKYPFKLSENNSFLIASLSMSSGCLIFTSLYKLLPEAMTYLEESTLSGSSNESLTLMISYLSGIVFCSVFNALLHLITSQSVVHCNHGGDDYHHEHDESSMYHSNNSNAERLELFTSDNSEDISEPSNDSDSLTINKPKIKNDLNSNCHSHTHQSPILDGDVSESTPLITPRPPMLMKKSLVDITLGTINHSNNDDLIGECKGYTSAELCMHSKRNHNNLHFCELPVSQLSSVKSNPDNDHINLLPDQSNHSSHGHNTSHDNQDSDHHHHITTPISRLLLIGIQTTLAITLHKLPEGFVTYLTSKTNPSLGFHIFLSLTIHNFTEGFSMCLPLYYSLNSRFKAILIAGSLGGSAQPLGALLGYLFYKYEKSRNRNSDDYLSHLNYVFGISLAVTSGFLTIISLQMFSSSISFGGSQRFVLFWCVTGILIIGFSSVLK